MVYCWLAGLWLLSFVVLWCIPASTAQSYTSAPHNMSQKTGKPISFLCGVSPQETTLNLSFTLHSQHGNYSLQCPGKSIDLLSKGMKAYCEIKGQELCGVWNIDYSTPKDEGTYVVCQSTGLPPVYGYLTMRDKSGYFTTLIACVVGGFVGILVVFGLAYIGLKHSEKFRTFLKGSTNQDDISTIVD